MVVLRSRIAIAWLAVAALTTGCDEASKDTGPALSKDRKTDKPAADPGDAPAKPAPKAAAANPDGVPGNVALVPGGKLVDKSNEGGVQTWTYLYPDTTPAELADRQRLQLAAGGWTTVIRPQLLPKLPPPVYAVLGHLDGTMVSALISPDRSSIMMTVVVRPTTQLVAAPDDYPAGFPFLPFGQRHKPATPPKAPRIDLVYNGSLAGIQAELMASARTGGWRCVGDGSVLTPCRKDGREVLVTIKELSSNRTVVFVAL